MKERYRSTVSLNIKNERVHELARRAAASTGLSQTAVIERALVQLLESRGEPVDDSSRRLAAARAVLADVDPDARRARSGHVTGVEDLYDERTGLPR